jgi:hypothetical protein
MGLLRMALIFGAGYALGRPEGRRKVAELAQRPEVKQAREQAVSTVSSGLETGKQRLSGKVSGAKDKNRGPSFPEAGARPDGPSVTAADIAPASGSPAGTASNASSLGTTSPGTTSPGRTASSPASPSPTPTGTSSGTPSTGGRSTGTRSAGTPGTKPSGTTASGTGSTEPDLPSTPPSTAR